LLASIYQQLLHAIVVVFTTLFTAGIGSAYRDYHRHRFLSTLKPCGSRWNVHWFVTAYIKPLFEPQGDWKVILLWVSNLWRPIGPRPV
jgi:hypothetical protein